MRKEIDFKKQYPCRNCGKLMYPCETCVEKGVGILCSDCMAVLEDVNEKIS